MSQPERESATLWDQFAAILRRWLHTRSPAQRCEPPDADPAPATTAAQDATEETSPEAAQTAATDGKLDEILLRLEAIERALFAPPSPGPASCLSDRDVDELAGLVRQLFERQQQSLAALIAEQRLPSEPEEPPRGESSDDEWRQVIFGPALAHDQASAPQIEELTNRLHEADPAALALAGQLMIFQGTPPARRPQLLKELGEAFYRCYPKESDAEDPFEQALIRWLEHECESAGFQNTIQTVHLGERFDSSRHLADGPGGIEVSDVRGWVVLRSRDKVYTKAVVSAR